ncbi:hypothetical protein Pres01_52010 [Metapseudomonas resinovorans]|uniref:hypothetical protein n=1 Tax=Metapseudomonas resinovorans TaxID=53412 RepID=UPI00131E4986|nr:hypothetical protein [Pseudomonas resinovorans]GLZ89150.1 hypothetical protein Pres01_52010 [Pseudomonas resinovorans]
MSISSCSDKTNWPQMPADLGELHERTPRLPLFSRAELYSFPAREDAGPAQPMSETTSRRTIAADDLCLARLDPDDCVGGQHAKEVEYNQTRYLRADEASKKSGD